MKKMMIALLLALCLMLCSCGAQTEKPTESTAPAAGDTQESASAGEAATDENGLPVLTTAPNGAGGDSGVSFGTGENGTENAESETTAPTSEKQTESTTEQTSEADEGIEMPRIPLG